MAELFTGLIYMCFLMALYFMPWITAHKNKHPNTEAIGIINIFLGWTFIGWVVALAWACMTPKE